MRNRMIVPALSIALVVALGWGYSQYQARRQWEINAENQYQRAFVEMTTHAGNMETELTKSLVAASFPQTLTLLTNIWRDANAFQEDLGQLPLASVDLSRTKTFLAQASAFSFDTLQKKLLQGQKLQDEEWKVLKSLRDQSRLVSRQLREMEQDFYLSQSRWLDVDRLRTVSAADLPQGLNNNKVTKAFLMLEDGLRRVPDLQFEGNNLDFEPKPTGLTGEKINARQAVEIARTFIGPDYRNADIKYERMIKGGFPSYMIAVRDPRRPERDLQLSVSEKGGHVAWMLGNREVREEKLNLDQAETEALRFAESQGYGNLQAVARESYGNIATFTLVPQRRRVLYYPELLKIQVAQDNGDILGFDAVAYLTFYDPKTSHQTVRPRLAEAQIREMLNSNLQVKRIQLAQVLDEVYNKVICYEVEGTLESDRFLIYYNAMSGKEEKIRRIDENGNELL